MIFVDTSAWFARVIPTDPNHAVAAAWADQNREPFVTTDYVIDETLTLLMMRGQRGCALALGEALFDGKLGHVCFLEPRDVIDAWQVFRGRGDKTWSFTDCTSKVVIEKLRLRRAFAFDRHFQQFGTVEVVPLGQPW